MRGAVGLAGGTCVAPEPEAGPAGIGQAIAAPFAYGQGQQYGMSTPFTTGGQGRHNIVGAAPAIRRHGRHSQPTGVCAPIGGHQQLGIEVEAPERGHGTILGRAVGTGEAGLGMTVEPVCPLTLREVAVGSGAFPSFEAVVTEAVDRATP